MEIDKAFNIQFVSNITGINPHTIRAWEKRYKAISPQRDQNGRRLYNNSEIKRLEILHDLVRAGNSISDIANLDDEELISIHQSFVGNSSAKRTNDANFDFDSCLQNLALAIDFYKLDILNHELQKALDELSPTSFAIKVVSPILTKIRHLKQEGKLEKEKRAPMFLIIKSHLNAALNRPALSANGQSIIIASAKGQLNALGSKIAAVLCKAQGLQIHYLGENVEASNLKEIITQFKSKYIFLGLDFSVEPAMEVYQKENYITQIGEAVEDDTKVLVGSFDKCIRLPFNNMICVSNFESLDGLFN